MCYDRSGLWIEGKGKDKCRVSGNVTIKATRIGSMVKSVVRVGVRI